MAITPVGTKGAMTPQIEAALRAITAARNGWISPTPTIDWGQASAAAKTPGYIDPAFTGGGRGLSPPVVGGGSVSNDPYSQIIKLLGAIPSLASLPGLATKQAVSSLQPSLIGLDLDSQIQQRQLANQQTRASEFAKALGAMNAQAGDQVYSNYADAAKTFGALGQGLTGAVASDWGDQTSKLNDAIAQMTGGRGGVVQGYDTAGMANTQNYANVGLPAADLMSQALRAGALTRAGVAADVGGVADIASQYGQKLTDAQAQLVADKGKLYATEPGLIQKTLDSLKADRTTQIGNLAKMVQARQGWLSDVAGLKLKASQQADASNLAWAKERSAEHTAAVYNSYLEGKGSLSQQEANWKHLYDQRSNNIKQANANTARMSAALRAAGITGVDVKGNVLPGWYTNPKTGAIEKQPANTAIGKDGMPHYLPGYHGSSSTSKNKPTGTSIPDFHKSMLDGLTSQWHIFAPNAFESALAKPHSKAEITSYLMRNYGNAFLARYPDQAQLVRDQIAAVARAAEGWLTTEMNRRKNAPKVTLTPSGDTGGGPTG